MGPRLFLGNGLADKYAKLGAQQQQHTAWHRQAYIQRYQLVQDVLEFSAYVGVLGRGIVDTSPPRGSEPPTEVPSQPLGGGPGPPVLAPSEEAELEAHAPSPPPVQPAPGLDRVGEGPERTGPAPPVLAESEEGVAEDPPPPPPPPLQPVGGLDGVGGRYERARAAGHRVVRLPRVSFCQRCARYAQDRWIGLLDSCPGEDPRKNAGRLKRLWQGKHPTTNRPF